MTLTERVTEPPNFTYLALTSPHSRDEWVSAWNALPNEKLWPAVVEMSRRGAMSPKATAEAIMGAVELSDLG